MAITKSTTRTWIKRGSLTLVCGLTVAGLAVSLKNIHELYHAYHETVEWKHKDTTPSADIPVSLLDASDKTKRNYENYNALEKNIWDASKYTFKSNVKAYDIRNLKTFHDALPKTSQRSLVNYTEIMDMWSIKKQLNELIVDNTLSKTISSSDLEQFITTNFNKLQPYLLAQSKHDYANQLYQQLVTLANDSNQYSVILVMVDQDFDIRTNNRLTTDMESKHIDALTTEIQKLHYKWDFITTVLNPILETAKPAIKANEQAHTRYNAYLADEKNKQSFNSYVDAYKSTQELVKARVIDLPDFTKKSLTDAQNWASANNITLRVMYKASTAKNDTVLSQQPDIKTYTRIVKGSTLTITVSQEIVSRETSSSSSSSSSSTSSSTSTQTEKSEVETRETNN